MSIRIFALVHLQDAAATKSRESGISAGFCLHARRLDENGRDAYYYTDILPALAISSAFLLSNFPVLTFRDLQVSVRTKKLEYALPCGLAYCEHLEIRPHGSTDHVSSSHGTCSIVATNCLAWWIQHYLALTIPMSNENCVCNEGRLGKPPRLSLVDSKGFSPVWICHQQRLFLRV